MHTHAHTVDIHTHTHAYIHINTTWTHTIPHEADHLGLSLADVLCAEKHCLHQCNEVFWSSEPEDVESPEVGKEEEEIREDETSEQVFFAVDDDRPIFCVCLCRLYWLGRQENNTSASAGCTG